VHVFPVPGSRTSRRIARIIGALIMAGKSVTPKSPHRLASHMAA
jgi:hypothetical protein